jgi:TatD DNase family protein
MTILADSHCHLNCLDLKNYCGNLDQVIAAARFKGVRYILVPGINLENLPDTLKIVANDSDLFTALGIHPVETMASNSSLEELLILGQNSKIIGIGETGLDFYCTIDELKRQKQRELFRLHIKVARELNKPLIIHARNADHEIINILKDEHGEEIGGVLHCFTGSENFALEAIRLGFYISISGIITFRRAEELKEVIKNLPRDRILIETDAPFLAPVPVRGSSNEPQYLPYIAEFVSSLFHVSYESFTQLTTENFLKLFNVK